jgi:ubiquinone/menaquinone biosynthesis C-methylase UbiE
MRMARTSFVEAYGGSAPENYERYFVPAIGRPLAADLMDTAALGPGERVLDVACGTGVVTRLAAERVGRAGTVAGLDINPGMLAVARSLPAPGVAIDWHQGSAESMPLPDAAFDVVLCQLGLQFVPDKAAAMREMRRVLAPRGRLVVSVSGPPPPPFAILDEALSRHIGPEAGSFVRLVFSLHDPDELHQLARGAGFRNVTTRAEAKELHLPPPAEFLWQYVQSTPLADAVARADDDRRAALERDVVIGWRPFVEDGGMVVAPTVVVATARK